MKVETTQQVVHMEIAQAADVEQVITTSVEPAANAVHPKEYTSLRKLTKRNEHTQQIRRTQSAATKIQRMWRRHLRRNARKH